MSEYLNSGTWNRDVIYLDGRVVAEINGAGVHELHCDQLGSPRMSTSGANGAVEGVQTFGPFGELLSSSGSYLPLTGYTGHLQTEPNGLIYMRGRYYSPAWHCFLSPDPGEDSGQWSRYAYANGNPLVNVDPTGMWSLGSVWGDITHGLHQFGHAMGVNWNHGRRDIIIGAAVVACIAIDIASGGTASESNPDIMAAAEGGTAADAAAAGGAAAGGAAAGGAATAASTFAIPSYVGYDAAIGFVTGGFVDARGSEWFDFKGAFQGAIYGASLGAGFDCVTTGINAGSWQAMADRAALYGKYAMKSPSSLWNVPGSAAIGGAVNMAFGSAKNPWNDFRDGAIVGGLTSLAGYSGFFGKGPGGYLASNLAGHSVYGMFSGQGPQLSDIRFPLGLGLTGILSGW